MREVYEIDMQKGDYFIYIDDIMVSGKDIDNWHGEVDENKNPINIIETPVVIAKAGYIVSYNNQHRFFVYCVSDTLNHYTDLRPKYRLIGHLIDDSVYQTLKKNISNYFSAAIYSQASFTSGFDIDIDYNGRLDSIIKFKDPATINLTPYEYMEVPVLTQNMLNLIINNDPKSYL